MRNKSRAGIRGIGVYVPERILTNQELEKMVDTTAAWIVSRSGIRERHIVAPEQATSDLALIAAERALTDAGMKAEEIDLVIVSSNTPDTIFPATACLVQNRLGIKRAGAFDLQAGCTGFLYGLVLAAQFVENGYYKNILLIGSECLSRITDYDDRKTCVLFGDGAGAVIVSQVPPGYGLLSSTLRSDGSGGDFLILPAGSSRLPASHETVEQKLHYIHMNGRELYKFAVRALEESSREALAAAGLTLNDVDYFISHQANIRIIEAVAKRLNMVPEKVAKVIERYGNNSVASIPLALHEALQEDKIMDGNYIVMTAFGAGLTWSAVVIRWYNYRNHSG